MSKKWEKVKRGQKMIKMAGMERGSGRFSQKHARIKKNKKQ
jgi:hypothetical protein